MKKTTLYIGLNDKDTKYQIIDTISAYKIITNIITEYADGGTIYAADGIYKHDDGTVVIEKTLRVELIDAPETAVKSIIQAAKVSLNQESILIQQEIVNSYFV